MKGVVSGGQPTIKNHGAVPVHVAGQTRTAMLHSVRPNVIRCFMPVEDHELSVAIGLAYGEGCEGVHAGNCMQRVSNLAAVQQADGDIDQLAQVLLNRVRALGRDRFGERKSDQEAFAVR